jgi:hypothetical protein
MEKKEYDSIEDNVFLLLEQFPQLRDSDFLLVNWYWQLIDKVPQNLPFYLLKYRNVTSFETIRRCRQKIQNGMGMFRPCGSVESYREENEVVMKNWVME